MMDDRIVMYVIRCPAPYDYKIVSDFLDGASIHLAPASSGPRRRRIELAPNIQLTDEFYDGRKYVRVSRLRRSALLAASGRNIGRIVKRFTSPSAAQDSRDEPSRRDAIAADLARRQARLIIARFALQCETEIPRPRYRETNAPCVHCGKYARNNVAGFRTLAIHLPSRDESSLVRRERERERERGRIVHARKTQSRLLSLSLSFFIRYNKPVLSPRRGTGNIKVSICEIRRVVRLTGGNDGGGGSRSS